ncbi:two-component response regulator ORR24-like [Impatiens glandulifera]|uniref:two-component response regulator ORR24-like n=1 Tax=Impatiens glandulifera TaxID=253017 RepID=UPI001FB10D01|nr:two-component response regulator ORR24-like [Impatiens glandulifera]
MWVGGPSSMAIHGVNPVPFPNAYRIFTQNCHILLVDNNSETLRGTAALLESCYYQVTAVESGLHAMSMLTSRKQHFDLVLTDAHLVDIDVFILLQESFNMEIPTIFMAMEEDPVIARTSIESGVCYFLEKPVNWNAVKGLWQYVMREKSIKSQRSGGDYGKFDETDDNDSDDDGVETRNRKMHASKKKRVGTDGSWEVQRRDKNRHSKKKTCTAWTEELHAKFIAAIDELGEGRCYPKEILQLMNVKGLTRMQVASHLQKCRNDNWRAPESRKSQSHNAQANVVHSHPEPNKITLRKFGSMPRLGKMSNPHNTSQSKSNSTQSYLPTPNHSSLGNLLGNDHQQHHHHHHQNGSYRVHHEFPNSNNQMETNYMNGGGSFDTNPRLMENIVHDIGNFGGQMVNGHRDNSGLDHSNSSMFMEMANHHPTHHVEPTFVGNVMMAAVEPNSHHQNGMVDDFFDFLPEAAEPSQGYPKMFNYGSSSGAAAGGTYTFEPYLFNQNQSQSQSQSQNQNQSQSQNQGE